MEWADEAIVIGTRPHGEDGAVVSLLTAAHGRYAGLVSGARKAAGQLQEGTHLHAIWRARLIDQLGTYTLETMQAFPARWMDNPEVLAVIASACAMAETCLPERQPMGGVYAALLALLSQEDAALFGPSYVMWEIGLLRALGYGLDLSQCAVTGVAHDLSHVSPRTGRAVNSEAAKPYREKLLTLPAFLIGEGEAEVEDVLDGLALTGHFLERHVLGHTHGLAQGATILPPARLRLADFYANLRESRTNGSFAHRSFP